MRRILVSALLASVFYVPAWADPLQIAPDAYPGSQSVTAGAAPQQDAIAGRQRFAATTQQPSANANQSNMGGGFIEFLFSGAARPPAVPRPYEPAMPEYQTDPAAQPGTMPDPQQGYAPSSDGDLAHAAPDPKYNRQIVEYTGKEPPGTIIIDTPNRFLFLVESDGKAMRYGVGVGRPGFTWAGVKTITAKREWPDWRPPSDMIKRRPDLPRYMAGGPENPLGARAMYLGSTIYRIHGSNEPWTIGTNVSSGCIRLRNEDVIDLYGRVKVGTKVVVM